MRYPRLELDEIKINQRPLENVLAQLIQRAEIDLTAPKCSRKVLEAIAVSFGILSAVIYIDPTKRITEGDAPFIRYSGRLGTIGINAIVNVFFDVDMVRDILHLKDPITGRWSDPTGDLAVTFGLSVISAFAFAFLGLGDNSLPLLSEKESENLSYVIFLMLIPVYTAQHYFGILNAIREGRLSFKLHKATSEALAIKDKLVSQIEAALFHLNTQFYLNSVHNGPRYSGYLGPTAYFRADKALDMDALLREIQDLSLPAPEKRDLSCLTHCFVNGLQITGLAVQTIGNLGYHNSTINGFSKLLNNLTLAWILASSSMAPVYTLAFVLSFQTINNLVNFLAVVLSKLYHKKSKEIWLMFPYSMRRAPFFSLITGSALIYLSAFSFFTSVVLLNEAIYNDNSDNPAHFGGMDNAEREGKMFYIPAGAAGAIVFNAFPVIPLVGWLSESYCNRFGIPGDKAAIQVLKTLKEVRARVERIPAEVFTVQRDLLREEEEIKTSSPRKTCWSAVKNGASSLSSCLLSFFKSQKPDTLAAPLLLNGGSGEYSPTEQLP